MHLACCEASSKKRLKEKSDAKCCCFQILTPLTCLTNVPAPNEASLMYKCCPPLYWLSPRLLAGACVFFGLDGLSRKLGAFVEPREREIKCQIRHLRPEVNCLQAHTGSSGFAPRTTADGGAPTEPANFAVACSFQLYYLERFDI